MIHSGLLQSMVDYPGGLHHSRAPWIGSLRVSLVLLESLIRETAGVSSRGLFLPADFFIYYFYHQLDIIFQYLLMKVSVPVSN